MPLNHLNSSNSSNLFENNIKLSFSKAKEHILALETEISGLKEVIFKQNEVLKQLSDRFLDISNQFKNLKNSPNQPISIGSEGVNQSINHLINQSISTKSLNHIDSANLSTSQTNFELEESIIEPIEEPKKDLKKPEISVENLAGLQARSPQQSEETYNSVGSAEDNKSSSMRSKGQTKEKKLTETSNIEIDLGTITSKRQINLLNGEISALKTINPEKTENEEKISQKLSQNQDFKINLDLPSQKKQLNLLDKEISIFKTNINKAFSSLSKQELRVFLTLYQLDDELNGVSYIELASKLELTEPCIRGYISTLIKKDLPIVRTKLNNKRTILIINKEFKSLGLKQKLVSLYYEADPRQTTLFDLKL